MISSGKKKIDFKSMLRRLLSTVLLWGVVAGVMISGNLMAVIGLTLALSILGVVEYKNITHGTPGLINRRATLVVSLLYLFWLAYTLLSLRGAQPAQVLPSLSSFEPEIVGLLTCLFVTFFLRLLRPINGMDSINAVGMNLLGFIYIPILFGGFMMRLTFLPPVTEVSGPEISGAWLLLFVAIVTKFTDMGAYLTGTLFGSTKMVKHISPEKTWEGTIGSFGVALLGAFGIWFLAGEKLAWMGDWWHIAILSVLISISAIIGDLAESILKRSVQTKDSGGMLPGIGGVLDLIDSICFSAPVTFFFLYYVIL